MERLTNLDQINLSSCRGKRYFEGEIIIYPGSHLAINGILLHDASSKLYFCEGTRKKRNGAITSPFGPIINLTNW